MRSAAGLIRAPGEHLRKIPGPIRLLSLGIFINRLGAYLLLFLALVLQHRGVPAWQIALTLLVVGGFSIAGSALGGYMVATVGARRTISLSMSGTGVFTALLAVTFSYPVMVTLLACISTASSACVPAATTTIGRLAHSRQRAPMFAFFQLAFNVGTAVGAVIGAYLLTRSLTALFLIDSSTSLIYALAALRLPRDAAPAFRRSRGRAGRNRLRRDRRYLVLCVSAAMLLMVYSQQAGALPLSIKAHHFSIQFYGFLLSMNAVSVILFQLPLSFLTRRLPPQVALGVAGGAMTLGYALPLLGMSRAVVIGNVALWTFGELILAPILPSLATAMSTDETLPAYQGALSVARNCGRVAGSSLGVFAYAVSPTLPWWGCLVVGAAATGLFIRAARGRREEAGDAVAVADAAAGS